MLRPRLRPSAPLYYPAMNRRAARTVFGLLLLAVLCTSCQLRLPLPKTPRSAHRVHLMLGNPSHRQTTNPSHETLFLRPQYALHYNRRRGTADWVSWQLNQTWLGDLGRPNFALDPNLPPRWYAVAPSDYSNSGFDRGHLVPAADRDRTATDAEAVFYMTNIVPQAPDNNRGPWEKLESDCREWVRQGRELYIMAGPLGRGGRGSKGPANTIDSGRVTVPAALWKVVVILDRPGLGLKGITADTPTVAVLMPNRQGIKDAPWQQFQTSIRALEDLTRYDFLAALPQPLQETLETRKPTRDSEKRRSPVFSKG